MQCHCSLRSSPSLLTKQPGLFCYGNVVYVLLFSHLGYKGKPESLGNNYFRALWCNKAWIKPDGHLVWVGMRNNQFCELEEEGKVLDSRYRDLSITIPAFGMNLLDVVGFVEMLVLACGSSFMSQRGLVKSTRLPMVLCPGAMKETRGFTGFYLF